MNNEHVNQQRILALTGVVNFRDIGGLPTEAGGRMQRGVLFRSDELSRLTKQDQAALHTLRLRLVCDLRTPNEARPRPPRLSGVGNVRRVHIPIQPQEQDPTQWEMLRFLMRNAGTFDFAGFLGTYYHTILFERTAQIGEVFRLISDPANQPALIHCTAGKDRTGLVAALAQLLAGVRQEAVMADYLLTNRFYAGRARAFTRAVRWMSLFRVSSGQMRHLLEARQEYLEAALERMYAQYGSVAAYLREACGVPEESLARLREGLIEAG